MTIFQNFFDKTAIGLSFMCTLHCLALPVLLVLLPSVASLQLDNEAFHYWMVLAVLPISLYALTLGCKQHKRLHLLGIGACGLIFLLMPLLLHEVLGHDELLHDVHQHKSILEEYGEKVFTVIGAGLIAFGHFRNYRLCQKSKRCCDG